MEINIISIVLTAFFTVIAGLVIWWATKDKLSLTYKVTASDSFPSQSGNSKYFVINIKNDGNKIAEDLVVEITFNSGKIAVAKITDDKIITDVILDNVSIRFKVPMLNPKEEINCITTIDMVITPQMPSISIRAKGAAAKEKNESVSTWNLINSITGGITIGVLAFFIGQLLFAYINKDATSNNSKLDSLSLQNETIIKSLDNRLEETKKEIDKIVQEEKLGKPDRVETIFSILNKAGLANKFPKLISNSNEDISYIGASFFLVHEYIKDVSNKEKYINALKGIINVGGIAPSTKGMIYYLIAKIEQHSNNPIIADEYLEKCKLETPLMYEHLMNQDKFHDLKKLERN
jgi:hypothetical protein